MTDSLECGENWQRESGDLNGTPNNIRDHKHGHAHLPSSALVWWPAHIVRVLLVFE